MELFDTIQAASRRDPQALVDVALGRVPADRVIRNGRLVNVYTGEIQHPVSVGIKDGWIAFVGADAGHGVGTGTDLIDAQGKFLLPGFIDAHTHLAWLCRADQYLNHLMPGGTTTIVTETMEVLPVAGAAGVVDFLESLAQQPVSIFATAPFMASTSRRNRGIAVETLCELLSRSDIVGLGESYWQSVLQELPLSLPLLDAAFRSGKTLEGHSAGARGSKLDAYLATGISSCHEPIEAEEVLQRLRLGIHVMIREGSIRRDLAAIAKINEWHIDTRRLVLVTDGLTPSDLIEKGGMEYVVQKAIDCGFAPVTAVQMATLNAAEHFGLDGILGGIAPGRRADVLIVADLHCIRPERVISGGRIVAENGCLRIPARTPRFKNASYATVRLPQPLAPADFAVAAPAGVQTATVRVVEMKTELVTVERRMEMTVSDGSLRCDPKQDLIKIAAVERTHGPDRRFTGFLKGFGLKSGALACSAAWDTSDIVVAGAAEADMAAAVNRIRELQGGAVFCEAGRVQAEIALPVFGLISEAPLKTVAEELRRLKRTVAERGCALSDPLLSLVTLTGAAIPFLRICEEGLVDLKTGETVGLFVR
jgi:adenine deaminase